MEQRAFGKSAIVVPAIGMGTWRTFDVKGRAEEASPTYGEAEREVLPLAE